MIASVRQQAQLTSERHIALGSIGLFVCASVILVLFNPVSSRFFPPCPFFLTTGCYCPGCGTTRAAHQLLRGDLVAALSSNILMVLALPVIGYIYLGFVSRSLFGWQLPALPTFRWGPWMIFSALIIYTVVRNIPIEPLSWLAP